MGMDFGDGVSFSVVPTAYKREDYTRTKYDTVFSNWKVLIGSNDWEDFNKGKDGVGRYRVENLPRRSCTGLYELGVAADDRNLDSDDVLAAYLGQAESVRARLQCYGRSGAHLRNLNNNNLLGVDSEKAAALFEDVFLKHASILYRWAPMGSKREAEATEGMLLSTFDYAWNKGSNGERRHLDLLTKLAQKKLDVGANFLTSIIKLSRTRIQPVVSDISDEISTLCSDSVCGVLLENGGCCGKSPVKGRKRCVEHKGQRVCRVSPLKHNLTRQEDDNQKETDVCCGVILPNMEPCTKRPVPGRKRCGDHKGMRINAFLFLLNRTDREKTVKSPPPTTNILEVEEGEALSRFCEATTKSGAPCTRSSPKGSKRCWQHKDSVVGKQVTCGAQVCNGLVCERSPVKGRKRCQEHKGMRLLSSLA